MVSTKPDIFVLELESFPGDSDDFSRIDDDNIRMSDLPRDRVHDQPFDETPLLALQCPDDPVFDAHDQPSLLKYFYGPRTSRDRSLRFLCHLSMDVVPEVQRAW
jgi:hypothetical protein